MANRVWMVTGVPGIGKTTLGRRVADLSDGAIKHISAGELFLKVVQVPADHARIRSEVDTLITADVIRKAKAMLLEAIATSDSETVLVDSRVVSPVENGFRVTLDSTAFLAEIAYVGIVQLVAPPAVILARYAEARGGRTMTSEEDIHRCDLLLQAVCVQYAQICRCPFYVQTYEKSVDEGAKVLLERIINAAQI